MTNHTNGILFVDDEELALRYFAKGMEPDFRVFQASSVNQALEILSQHHEEIALLISDQRMPQASGVDFFLQAKEKYPDKIRILTSAYSDHESTLDAFNQAQIYYFVQKPWNLKELKYTLLRALDYFVTEQENSQLKDRLAKLMDMIATDRTLALGLIAADLGHFVNNALVPAITFIGCIKDKIYIKDQSTWDKFCQDVHSSLMDISTSLGTLGEIAQPPQPKSLKPVNLCKIAESAAEKFKKPYLDQNLSLQLQSTSGEVTVQAYPVYIEKLFSLLLAEALCMMSDGGKVTIDIEPLNDTPGKNASLINICFQKADDSFPLAKNAKEYLYPFGLNLADFNKFDFNIHGAYLITKFHNGHFKIEHNQQNCLQISIKLPYQPQHPKDCLSEDISLAEAIRDLRKKNLN